MQTIRRSSVFIELLHIHCRFRQSSIHTFISAIKHSLVPSIRIFVRSREEKKMIADSLKQPGIDEFANQYEEKYQEQLMQRRKQMSSDAIGRVQSRALEYELGIRQRPTEYEQLSSRYNNVIDVYTRDTAQNGENGRRSTLREAQLIKVANKKRNVSISGADTRARDGKGSPLSIFSSQQKYIYEETEHVENPHRPKCTTDDDAAFSENQ